MLFAGESLLATDSLVEELSAESAQSKLAKARLFFSLSEEEADGRVSRA